MADSESSLIPEAHFGNAESPLPDWRKEAPADEADDDEELPETPSDVTAMLGFDPLEFRDIASDDVLDKPFDKSEVEYGEGQPEQHCGNCGHFTAPHECELVNGGVDEDKWCNLWADFRFFWSDSQMPEIVDWGKPEGEEEEE